MTLYKLKDLIDRDRFRKSDGTWETRLCKASGRDSSRIAYLGEYIYSVYAVVRKEGQTIDNLWGEGRVVVSGYVVINPYDQERTVWSSIEDAKAAIRSELLAEGKIKAVQTIRYVRTDDPDDWHTSR